MITAIRNDAIVDRYHTSGSAVQQVGWKVLDLAPAKAKKAAPGAAERRPNRRCRRDSRKGQPQDVLDVEVLKKKTRAPKRFTEGTLLTAMETAGKTLDEKELSDAMKETGLGTPATRASIIEVLLKREYIVRNGKSLEATDKGIRLIEVVHPEVKSPVMTGQWEAYLHRIQRGTAQLGPSCKGIEDYVREVVGKVGQVHAAARSRRRTALRHTPVPQLAEAPPACRPQTCTRPSYTGAPLTELLQTAFGFPSFRASQEAVCQAVIAGRDVLLVMPTGAGKSLCYQLPGIARGGTTLVISPLIALMEDQVAKLKERNFAVECIHSGRDRAASRQACIDYLNGNLQFLFIAPERLRVSGFPEMLAKRKPSLIAIDEAHCISQWGHDFRPDYRMLGQYLPTLRPAPVIALTATATPIVQNDIAVQLGLGQPARFIQGFRRDNLAIEVVEVAPSQRADLTLELLDDEERRPAIVYTPTRAQATSLAAELAQPLPLRRLPRRARCRAPQARPGGVSGGPHRGDGRHHRLRHGDRQARRAHRDSHRAAGQPGSVLPGDRPRGPRRRTQPHHPDALLRGPPHARFLLRARLPRRARCSTAIFGRLRAEPVEKAALQHQLRMDRRRVRQSAREAVDSRRRAGGFRRERQPRPRPLARALHRAGRPEAAAARLDAPLRRKQRVPHGRAWCAISAIWRTRRKPAAFAISALPPIAWGSASARPTKPNAPRRSRWSTCFVRTAAAPPANCTRTSSRTGRCRATSSKRSSAPWRAPISSAWPTPSLKRTARPSRTARRA